MRLILQIWRYIRTNKVTFTATGTLAACVSRKPKVWYQLCTVDIILVNLRSELQQFVMFRYCLIMWKYKFMYTFFSGKCNYDTGWYIEPTEFDTLWNPTLWQGNLMVTAHFPKPIPDQMLLGQSYSIYNTIYARESCFVVFSCGPIQLDFTHIIQCHLTGTGI